VAGTLWTRAMASSDAFERKSLLGAIARSDDPRIATWVLEHMRDPKLRSSEKLQLLSGLSGELRTRELGLEWLEKNFQQLARETNLSSVNYLFSLPNGSCTTEAADKAEAVFRSELQKLGRGALSLERAIETVRACAATRQARGAELETVLRAVVPAGT
jgi:hypothetical protein